MCEEVLRGRASGAALFADIGCRKTTVRQLLWVLTEDDMFKDLRKLSIFSLGVDAIKRPTKSAPGFYHQSGVISSELFPFEIPDLDDKSQS